MTADQERQARDRAEFVVSGSWVLGGHDLVGRARRQACGSVSTAGLPRPIIVLSQNRFDDIHRHRFTAAHELGHMVLHGDTAAGDMQQEREADAFAAEFLTTRNGGVPGRDWLWPELLAGYMMRIPYGAWHVICEHGPSIPCERPMMVSNAA